MKKFRVEAFIIPTNTIANDIQNYKESEKRIIMTDEKRAEDTESNEIDDVKLANKIKEQSFNSDASQNDNTLEGDVKVSVESNENQNTMDDSKCSENMCDESSEFSGEFFRLDEHIYDEIIVPKTPINNKIKEISVKCENSQTQYSKAFLKIEEPIYDEPYISNFTVNNRRNENVSYDVPQSHWALAKSKYRRFGIVAPKIPKRTSSLHSIIEDIETVDKSLDNVCLHGVTCGCTISPRGPEAVSEGIFKENWMQKLSALKNLETLLRDKEIALQSRERLLFKKEKELRILEKLVKDKMRQAELYARRCNKAKSSDSIFSNMKNSDSKSDESKTQSKSEISCEKGFKVFKVPLAVAETRNVPKCPYNSKISLAHDRNSQKIGSLRSRSRIKHRKSYDDLDSTLSADIGDSSLIITSKKFDPTSFKKPLAFARSASERRISTKAQAIKINSNIAETNECINYLLDPTQEKIFKKLSDNIVACQNQETKFQNYGLIDESENKKISTSTNKKDDSLNGKKFSYLNLESLSKTLKLKNTSKEKSMTWNEEMDNWLRKKREAYNMSAKNASHVNISEKENSTLNDKFNKSLRNLKAKDAREKKFSIFR